MRFSHTSCGNVFFRYDRAPSEFIFQIGSVGFRIIPADRSCFTFALIGKKFKDKLVPFPLMIYISSGRKGCRLISSEPFERSLTVTESLVFFNNKNLYCKFAESDSNCTTSNDFSLFLFGKNHLNIFEEVVSAGKNCLFSLE